MEDFFSADDAKHWGKSETFLSAWNFMPQERYCTEVVKKSQWMINVVENWIENSCELFIEKFIGEKSWRLFVNS